MKPNCSTQDCDKPVRCRGLCANHYGQWRRRNPGVVLPRKTMEERFWEKVDKSETCWAWTGSLNKFGYGQFRADGKTRKAHVLSLEMATGTKRPEGSDTCHHCDNPKCVRPSHLYFGTRQQNVDDAWARNRFPVGSERHSAKITEIDVIAMRHEYAAGAEVEDLQSAYGLANSTIRCIVLGIKWKHVGGPITRRRKTNNRKAA